MSEILERSKLESDILPPTPQPWSEHISRRIRGRATTGVRRHKQLHYPAV